MVTHTQVRLSKMLRLARIKRIMQKYENLMELQQYMGIIVMLCIVVFTAHFMACMWYAAGSNVQTLEHSYVTELTGGGKSDNAAYDVYYLPPYCIKESSNVRDTLMTPPVKRVLVYKRPPLPCYHCNRYG